MQVGSVEVLRCKVRSSRRCTFTISNSELQSTQTKRSAIISIFVEREVRGELLRDFEDALVDGECVPWDADGGYTIGTVGGRFVLASVIDSNGFSPLFTLQASR